MMILAAAVDRGLSCIGLVGLSLVSIQTFVGFPGDVVNTVCPQICSTYGSATGVLETSELVALGLSATSLLIGLFLMRRRRARMRTASYGGRRISGRLGGGVSTASAVHQEADASSSYGDSGYNNPFEF